MYPAVNAWAYTNAASPEDWLAAAAGDGFAGLEPVIGLDGPLTPDTPAGEFAALARKATDAGLKLTSLATGLFWQFNYGSPQQADRQRAAELTIRMLDQAVAAGAGAILVVPAVVGTSTSPRGQISYADGLTRTVEALSALRFEAEARGVTIALENVWNRFLLSPVEAADVLDRVNSPNVGFYLDVGNVLAFGYPEDWIATLGGRISRVHVKDYDLSRPGQAGFCRPGTGSVDWAGVLHGLRSVGYDGPLTYEGGEEPATVAGWMRTMLEGEDGS